MAREGALISKHPLLIQKTMADKLSDKISVIIAPPSTNGDFIGASLLGTTRNGKDKHRARRAGHATLAATRRPNNVAQQYLRRRRARYRDLWIGSFCAQRRDSAPQQTVLSQGDSLEVRGEKWTSCRSTITVVNAPATCGPRKSGRPR